MDTVELFHFKRQRKLSLRFLAGYLLGAAIQKDTHDSIVDARTALSLFEVIHRAGPYLKEHRPPNIRGLYLV